MKNIKEHCCGADKLFDLKTANKQYKRYLKKGPSRVTSKLIGQLEDFNIEGTLLDVGGGIGAIQWWFLANGGKETFGVDASSGYTEIAQEHARKSCFEDRTHFFVGDLMDHCSNIPKANHISLDKVICCYPNYQEILNVVCGLSTHTVSLTYPMDGIIARIIRSFGVLMMKIRGNPFRPFVHRVTSVRALFSENGYVLKKRELSFPWHVETYQRVNS